MGENNRAVGKRVIVHKLQTFLEGFDPLKAQHRPENFLRADAHLFGYAIQDGWPDVEAIFLARHLNSATVEHQLCPLLNAFINPVDDRLLMIFRNHRTHIGIAQIAGADFQLFGFLGDGGNQLISDLFLHHDNRQRHAAFARAAKRGVDNPRCGTVNWRIGQHQGMVFRFAQRLNALAVSGGFGVNVQAHGG